jgi:arsenite oxidase small subunit
LDQESKDEPDKVEELLSSRRNFLKLALTVSGVAVVGSVGSLFRVLEFIPSTSGPTSWPVVKIANISSLDPAKPLRFNYPLVDTPSVLVKTGTPADNGVGPDSDIVAYSDVCQHLGCIFSILPAGASPPCNPGYSAPAPQGYCCCHGGQYDLVHGGQVIGGPPVRPIPQVILRFDSATGDIYAIGMTAPTIFGHGPAGTTSSDLVLRYDLQGGTPVTDATVFSNTG